MATSALSNMVTSLDRDSLAEPPVRLSAQPPTEFPDQYLTLQGIRLRYWQAGDEGPPLLLLHGLNGCVENWRWNIGAFAQHYRVFALDGPGHGLSQPDER